MASRHTNIRAVILDAATLGSDIDFSLLQKITDTLEIHDNTSSDPNSDEVISRLQHANVAITNKVVLDARALEALPNLKLICVMATGTNNIDLETAQRLNIEVRNITAYGTASVAQHTFMLMLALANRLPLYQDELRRGRWQSSEHFCLLNHTTMQLAGRHLVLVGQGELGKRVSMLARAMDMTVSFAARPGNESSDHRPPLDALLADADLVSLHCPLTDATRHLINARRLRYIKPGCILINCARGGLIDELAALAALRDGRLGGLGVDVLPQEPPRDGHPLLQALEEPLLNLIVTPHNAWISPEARQTIIDKTAANIQLGW